MLRSQPHRLDLCLIERFRSSTKTQNFQDAGSCNNGDRTMSIRVKAAEYVPRKQWRVDLFDSVRPLTAATVDWSQDFVALCGEQGWNYETVALANL